MAEHVRLWLLFPDGRTYPAEAVPELLKALEKIVFDWDGEPEDMFDARAVLAKARGPDDG